MKQSKSIKLTTLFVIILTILAVVVGVVGLRWAYQSSEVLVINNSPVPVKPPEVTPEGKIYMTIDFCKKQELTDKTTVVLVGETAGANISVNWPTGKTTPQCTVYDGVPLPIPAQTPTDTYHAVFEVCYDINPLKKNRCTSFTTESFKVVNSKLNPDDAKPVGEL